MLYVERDKHGNILAIYKNEKPGTEKISISDSEILSFLLANLDTSNEAQLDMLASDLNFVRVLEDLIAILIKKELVHLTDFPSAAIDKMSSRQKMREHCKKPNFTMEEDDDIEQSF